jgi:hypothetical protein
VNAQLVAAGCLAVLAAAVHGVAGEVLVVRKLAARTLPSTRFGGPGMTRTMIQATWHMTTFAFLVTGCALVAAGAVLRGDPARALALVAAVATTGFAVLAVGMGAAHSPRALLRHLGPIALSATAALAWWGALS